MKALIIEDEILALKHLRQILIEVGNIDVTGTLESIAETIEWLKNNPQPDILFLDIHLADGNAFEIFKHLEISCPVVFTTAYDEYALKAFKVNSIDYLLKPVEVDDVRKALTKLKGLSDPGNIREALHNLITSYGNNLKYRSHFLLPVKGDKLIPVQTSDLACFFIDSGVVRASSFDGKTYRFDHTLDELEELLDPGSFFRANRQYIISRKAIKDVDLWFNSRLSVNLKVSVPEKILISKARISEFKKWFGS